MDEPIFYFSPNKIEFLVADRERSTLKVHDLLSR